MKKVFLSSLLFGAALLTSSMFVSCGDDDDIDDLKSRMEVVEGNISELRNELAALQSSGATVVSAEQDANGVWTIKLSTGREITLSAAGGGSKIQVTENLNNIIINVDGTEYVLPKSASACLLIYSPQFEDGIEIINGSDPVNVQFMVQPGLTADFSQAKFDIQEAHVLKTRAGSDLFEIADGASYSNGVLTVPVKALNVEAGSSYAVSVVMTLDGKSYISNYFTIKIGPGYSYVSEDLQDYGFASSVTDAKKNTETNVWTATLPADLVDNFSFANFFTGLPSGCTFKIAGMDQQSSNAKQVYDILKNSLASDGKWSLSDRPGCAFPEGFQVNIVKDGLVKMKVNWIFNDPLANVDFDGVYKLGTGGHIEIAGATNDGSDMLKAGAQTLDFQALFSKAVDDNSAIPLMHDGGNFINNEWAKYTASYKEDGDIVYNDGTRYVLGDVGKKYAVKSKGLYWVTYQMSIASSNRRNILDRPADEGSNDNIAWCGGTCNGEIIGGYDGISDEDKASFGISIDESGKIVTTANYKGWAFRAGLWCVYQYVYGQVELAHAPFVYVWCNRRSCPEGVQDPSAR